ncbi:hypothetical protein CsatA_018854 [Cannabis sativa]
MKRRKTDHTLVLPFNQSTHHCRPPSPFRCRSCEDMETDHHLISKLIIRSLYYSHRNIGLSPHIFFLKSFSFSGGTPWKGEELAFVATNSIGAENILDQHNPKLRFITCFKFRVYELVLNCFLLFL